MYGSLQKLLFSIVLAGAATSINAYYQFTAGLTINGESLKTKLGFEAGAENSNYKIKVSRDGNSQGSAVKISLAQILGLSKEGAELGLMLRNRRMKLFIKDFYKFSFERAGLIGNTQQQAASMQWPEILEIDKTDQRLEELYNKHHHLETENNYLEDEIVSGTRSTEKRQNLMIDLDKSRTALEGVHTEISQERTNQRDNVLKLNKQTHIEQEKPNHPSLFNNIPSIPISSTVNFDVKKNGSISFDSVSFSTPQGDTSLEDYTHRMARSGNGEPSANEVSSVIAIELINTIKQAAISAQLERAEAIRKEVIRLRKARGLPPLPPTDKERKEELLIKLKKQVYDFCAAMVARRGNPYERPA